jgi:hypothetical protein
MDVGIYVYICPYVCIYPTSSTLQSERVQFNQLCLQNVANVWRKGAFATLLDNYQDLHINGDFGAASPASATLGNRGFIVVS